MALFPLGILSAAGAGGVEAGAYELISSEILGSSQSSVTFSSLGDYSSTYKHLQIRASVRLDRSGESNDLFCIRYNGDTGANYSFHRLSASGSAVQSEGAASGNEVVITYVAATTATAGLYTGMVIDILDAYNTSKNTTTRTFMGQGGADRLLGLFSSVWLNTSALTSINLRGLNSTGITAGSRFSLYGIKG
jgi:hypothetical protein